jgi:choline dehydrogenase-like flavoprotein
LSAFIDARTLPSGTVLEPDLAIIGGGPVGISLALALAGTRLKIALLESGGGNFDPAIQKMYRGSQTGIVLPPLEYSRLRYLGGSTNHWGGWCRPLDAIDFEKRDWLPYSGWPITQKDLAPYYPRAQTLVEAGPWFYEKAGAVAAATAPLLDIGRGGIYTSWFQFSKTRGDVLPTHFGTRYESDLKAARNLTLYEHANVMGLRLSPDARRIDHLDMGTLTGKRFTVKPRYTVLATGGMENARLLLASNDVAAAGVGNGNDLVGRFFADTPTPRDTGTMVIFGGAPASYYGATVAMNNGMVVRATFAPDDAFRRQNKVLGSLTTLEEPVALDDIGRDAVVATALALGVDASGARTYSLGCGMELPPDPERRLTLTNAHDALGMPRLKVNMTMPDSVFAQYNRTMRELGRQMLAARTGMIRINLEKRAQWLAGDVMTWGNHHMGTTRMSDDPKSGVVDADLAVHGVPNLFVAGSSVFPTYGASNPTLNLLALTLRLADHLKKVTA